MAVSWHFYDLFKNNLGKKKIDLSADSIKVALLTSSYTPSMSHAGYSDLTNELTTGVGYTATGQALTTQVFTNTSGTEKFDADDVQWSASGGDIGPARYAAMYSDTSVGDLLIGYIDFGADKTAGDGTPFLISWNASGIFTLA